MKVSVTFQVSDLARRGINLNHGRDGLATREQIKNAIGTTVDVWLDDMTWEAQGEEAEAEEARLILQEAQNDEQGHA